MTRLWILLFCFAVACTDAAKVPFSPDTDADGKADGWTFSNDPNAFGIPLVTELGALPTDGRAEIVPWTETYWPAMDDSFNARWQGPGTLSPLEKYDLAFNGWTPPPGFERLRPLTPASCRTGAWDPEYYDALGPAARYWSERHGVGRAHNGRDDDGDGLIDECDDLDGMEDWWGSCHAWTPASMLEPEPLEPVTFGGVRFEVSDLKALLILLYEESRQIAVGDRCVLDRPTRDAHGRIEDEACRNTNAGTFHLLVTNLLGLRGQAFGEDRVATREVWNQPLAGYRITEQREVAAAEAIAALGRADAEYPFNPRAQRFAVVTAELDYVTESHPSVEPTTPVIDRFLRTDTYRYVLELDAAGHVIGGEWIASRAGTTFAHADRPDYLWLPVGPGRQLNPHVRIENVRRLHRQSRSDLRAEHVVTHVQDVDRRIPDIDWRGISSTIVVPETGVARRVSVFVEVLHDWMYDVRVTLIRNGEEHVLFAQRPQGSPLALVGSFEVEALRGSEMAGEWTLRVSDHNASSQGRFVRWGLDLVTTDGAEPETPDPTPEPEEQTFTSVGDPQAIPDASPAGIERRLEIPSSVLAREVEILVDVTHSYRGDLRVVLERGATQLVLHDRSGGNADDLALRIPAPSLAGLDLRGTWTLRVSDHARADVGTLDAFALRVRR
ncbi:MAG: proprotein convertase P-domain-containing protein [Sandaracinus sp.]|nr:proprotein convertase P-domain-containing protein [Sandaracinus sp.]MCB9619372.1 proprotein convertase P-domain-containing protein [Sandaracinus sp.]MCB9621922.1 proprotein convertase P-domain-containing protein [Sandaracinus sp.]